MEDYFQPAMTAEQLQSVGVLALAHVGDGVYELLTRTWLCTHGKATGRSMHRATVALVCAESQARRSAAILPLLTEEESAVFKRGRNAHVHSVPHHASRAEYGAATAVETLFGWLYLQGRLERVNALFCAMMGEDG